VPKPIACFALLLLTACASNPDAPVVETVTVRVPVPVPCIDAAAIPAPPDPAVPATGDVGQLAAGAAAEVYAWRAYGKQADPLLRACAVQPATGGKP
jgi:hypothetical protein